jgi:CHAT domain-containing protein
MRDDFKEFRTYSASDLAGTVATDLLAHFSPYIVVRDEDYWSLAVVDDDLLAWMLDSSDSVQEAMHPWRSLNPEGPKALKLSDALRAWKSVHFDGPKARNVREPSVVSLLDARRPRRSIELMSTDRSVFQMDDAVFLDDSGAVRGLLALDTPSHFEPKLGGPSDNTLYPSIHTDDGAEVVPDKVVEYCLSLSDIAPVGLAFGFDVRFPEGADTLTLHVEVSSNEFEPIDGEAWYKEIIVDRQLRCSPSEWRFKARPIGDRVCYSFTVRFLAAGNVAGSLTYTAIRRGTTSPASPPKSPSPRLTLPKMSGAKLMVSISERGNTSFEISLFENGKRWEKPKPWDSEVADLFNSLEMAKSGKELIQLGFALWADLPKGLRSFLERSSASGASTMFVSNSRIAPFEILQLRPQKKGPLLGIDRPVVRWIKDFDASTTTELAVPGVACIRPNYSGRDRLEDAELEEKDLNRRFAELRVARSKTDCDGLLDNEDQCGIIHFAGHGSDAPAKLILEDGEAQPGYFHPSRKLIDSRHPLFFLNACRVGNAAPLGLAFRSNFVKILIASGFSAVVANMIEVNSIAARKAACKFYDAVSSGATIGDAVRQIHQLADDTGTPEEHKASYLSYLAFAPSALKLKFYSGVIKRT